MNRLYEIALVLPPKGLSTPQMNFLIHELQWTRSTLNKAEDPWFMQMVFVANDIEEPAVMPADIEAVLRYKVPCQWRTLPAFTGHKKNQSVFAFLHNELRECATVFCCLKAGESNHGRSRAARLFQYAQERGGSAAARFKLLSDSVERPGVEASQKLAAAKKEKKWKGV